jgi:threonine synthase
VAAKQAGKKKAAKVETGPAAKNNKPHDHSVLIIEDNPLDGRLVRRTLEQRVPCHILQAHSGEQAFQMLKQHTPNLIILDLVLPDMSGFDVLKRVRENPSTEDVPVVVLTAKELTKEEQALLKNQVDFTLTKGAVDKEALQDHVYKVIGKADK